MSLSITAPQTRHGGLSGDRLQRQLFKSPIGVLEIAFLGEKLFSLAERPALADAEALRGSLEAPPQALAPQARMPQAPATQAQARRASAERGSAGRGGAGRPSQSQRSHGRRRGSEKRRPQSQRGHARQEERRPLAEAYKSLLEAKPALMRDLTQSLLKLFRGERADFAVPLFERGTLFQQKVWAALQRVPFGETVSYSELARRAGNARAVRAAASACARNPFLIIVPCHRAVGKRGLGGYRLGLKAKRLLLGIENARF